MNIPPFRRRGRRKSGASTYSNLLPVWAAALLFTGYGAAFAAVGSRFVLRRDVT